MAEARPHQCLNQTQIDKTEAEPEGLPASAAATLRPGTGL